YWKIDIVGKEDKGTDKVELKVKLTARPTGEQQQPTTREDKIVAVREEGGWRLLLSEFVGGAKSGNAADESSPDAKALKAAIANKSFSRRPTAICTCSISNARKFARLRRPTPLKRRRGSPRMEAGSLTPRPRTTTNRGLFSLVLWTVRKSSNSPTHLA